MITFSPRDKSLEPTAAIALGPVACALAKRLLSMNDDQLSALRGTAGRAILAITGESETLPWVDGIIYLGRDPAAPRLLLPTMLRPSTPAHALEGAIARRAASAPKPGAIGPWAVLADPPCIIPLGESRPIERARLLAWLEAAP